MANVTDTIRVRGIDWLDISIHTNNTDTAIDTLPDETAIRVKVTVKQSITTYGSASTETDTAYTAFTATVTATDAAGDNLIVGATSLSITGANGVANKDDCTFEITGKTEPFLFTAVTTQTEDTIKATTGRTYYPEGVEYFSGALAASYKISAADIADCVGGDATFDHSALNGANQTADQEVPVGSDENTWHGFETFPSGVTAWVTHYEVPDWDLARQSQGSSNRGIALSKGNDGYWWVRFAVGAFGGYGTSRVAILNFRASTTNASPIGLTYAYVSLTKDSHAGTPTNTGAGTVTVAAV